jgi:hypothetical protein
MLAAAAGWYPRSPTTPCHGQQPLSRRRHQLGLTRDPAIAFGLCVSVCSGRPGVGRAGVADFLPFSGERSRGIGDPRRGE